MSDTSTQAKGQLFGIGIGPGDPDLLTVKAVKVLLKADVIYVPKSKEQASTALDIVRQYLPDHVVIEQLEFSMSRDLNTRISSRKHNAQLISNELDAGKNCVFVTLGDPMLYSTYSYVLEYLDERHKVETIPGIYSFSAISSLLSLPLCKGDDKLAVICSFDEQTPQLIESVDTVVFMKVSAYHKQLSAFLQTHPTYQFVMISDVGKSNQTIHHSIGVLEGEVPYFSTVILQKEKILKPLIKETCLA